MRSSKSKRDRHCINISNNNDDDSTQIISIAVFQNENNVTFDFKFHIMSTEIQDAFASVTIDKIDSKFENENDSIDENEKNALLNRYVYNDKQYIYTVC